MEGESVDIGGELFYHLFVFEDLPAVSGDDFF